MTFSPDEPTTRPEGKPVMRHVRVWWLKGLATPWALLFDDGTFVRAKRFRVIAGHVKSSALCDNSAPFELPDGIVIPPAGWLEVIGEVVYDV